jgi:hypothetical protein
MLVVVAVGGHEVISLLIFDAFSHLVVSDRMLIYSGPLGSR